MNATFWNQVGKNIDSLSDSLQKTYAARKNQEFQESMANAVQPRTTRVQQPMIGDNPQQPLIQNKDVALSQDRVTRPNMQTAASPIFNNMPEETLKPTTGYAQPESYSQPIFSQQTVPGMSRAQAFQKIIQENPDFLSTPAAQTELASMKLFAPQYETYQPGTMRQKVAPITGELVGEPEQVGSKTKFQSKGITDKGFAVNYDPAKGQNFVSLADGSMSPYDERLHGKIAAKQPSVKDKGILDKEHGALTVGYDPSSNQYTVTEKDGNVRPYDASKDGDIHLLGEATQMRTAAERGISYAEGRAKYNFKQVIDTTTGNLTNVSNLDIMKDPSRYVEAGTGQKVMTRSALIEDIRGNISQTRETIKNLDNDFDAGFKTKLSFALRQNDPASAISAMINSEAATTLTEKQLDFLNSLNFLTENAMAMRSVLGAGQGSEDLRKAITNTLPGIMSPNKQYAQKQLDLFEKTLDRLKRGIPQGQGGKPILSGGTQPTGKKAVRKGYNAKTNQTQFIYDDGTSEIVDGKK
jgi:hypothetical protein